MCHMGSGLEPEMTDAEVDAIINELEEQNKDGNKRADRTVCIGVGIIFAVVIGIFVWFNFLN